MVVLLARENISLWQPITNKTCGETSLGKAYWRQDGQSASCSYCGSMSTEELLECLSAIPKLDFSLADSSSKVYIARYPHAGACPEPPTVCNCSVKVGGGPIKFRTYHLFDGARTMEEAEHIWYRVRVECQRSWNELTAKMRNHNVRNDY